MANLGKCLLFYLKYPAEMERLYEADEPDVKGLPNPDQILKKITLVGDAASREVAELLEACAPAIEKHFRAIRDVERVRKNPEKTWSLSFRVLPRSATEKRFYVCVAVNRKPAALIPWVWCFGGRRAEDEVIRVLRRGNKSIPSEGWESGSVLLEEIKILIPERLEEPVAREPLIAQVQQALASLTKQEIKAIAAISSKGGKP